MTSQAPRPVDGAHRCGDCGSAADPDEPFCDACGAVLSWGRSARPASTSAVRRPTTTSPTDSGHTSDAAPEDAPARPTAPGTSAATSAVPSSAATDPGAGQASARADADAPTAPSAPTASDGSGSSASARARNLIVPVPDRQLRQPPPEAAPVLPGRPGAHVLEVRAPARADVVPDGIACPWCSTSNAPARHFCDRCAMPMSGTADAGRTAPSWWRRLLDRRNRPAPWAGDRPRLRFGFDRVGNWLGAMVVLALIVCAVVYTGPAVDAVRDHFVKRAPVAPDRVKASRSYAGHGAPLAFDRINNTWWGPGVSQSGDGDWLEASFDRPTRLLDLVVTPGVSARGDELSKSAQPHQVDAVITTADGKKVTRRLTFDQGAGAQRRRFTVGEVTSVRLVVRSAYHASEDKQLAIAEVEFFGPSSGNSG